MAEVFRYIDQVLNGGKIFWRGNLQRAAVAEGAGIGGSLSLGVHYYTTYSEGDLQKTLVVAGIPLALGTLEASRQLAIAGWKKWQESRMFKDLEEIKTPGQIYDENIRTVRKNFAKQDPDKTPEKVEAWIRRVHGTREEFIRNYIGSDVNHERALNLTNSTSGEGYDWLTEHARNFLQEKHPEIPLKEINAWIRQEFGTRNKAIASAVEERYAENEHLYTQEKEWLVLLRKHQEISEEEFSRRMGQLQEQYERNKRKEEPNK